MTRTPRSRGCSSFRKPGRARSPASANAANETGPPLTENWTVRACREARKRVAPAVTVRPPSSRAARQAAGFARHALSSIFFRTTPASRSDSARAPDFVENESVRAPSVSSGSAAHRPAAPTITSNAGFHMNPCIGYVHETYHPSNICVNGRASSKLLILRESGCSVYREVPVKSLLDCRDEWYLRALPRLKEWKLENALRRHPIGPFLPAGNPLSAGVSRHVNGTCRRSLRCPDCGRCRPRQERRHQRRVGRPDRFARQLCSAPAAARLVLGDGGGGGVQAADAIRPDAERGASRHPGFQDGDRRRHPGSHRARGGAASWNRLPRTAAAWWTPKR